MVVAAIFNAWAGDLVEDVRNLGLVVGKQPVVGT
jgi:hypothetical protein